MTATATATVQIRSKGIITLPIDLREKYKLEKGKVLSIIDLGEGKILLTMKASRLSKITARIEENLKEENVTLDDVLEQLDEERKIYNLERSPRSLANGIRTYGAVPLGVHQHGRDIIPPA